jgi:hypothetical protein
MKKAGFFVLAAAAIFALADSAFAIDSYIFPTDVLPQSNFAVEAGYNFFHADRTDNFPGGSFNYDGIEHSVNLNSQAGLGYGVQLGISESAITSSRVTNTKYTTSPTTKFIFDESGFENPTLSVKISPTSMVNSTGPLAVAIQYAYTPGHWGSTHVTSGADSQAISVYGSLATGAFRNYIGWVGRFYGAPNYRPGTVQTIALGTEYNYSKRLALTLDADLDYNSSSTFAGPYYVAGGTFGLQYAMAKNVFLNPYVGMHYQEHNNSRGLTHEDTFTQNAGVAIKVIF